METGFEPVYTALQAVASPLGHSTEQDARETVFRADDGIRTRDPHLGKVMRYQLRYVRMHAAGNVPRLRGEPTDNPIALSNRLQSGMPPSRPYAARSDVPATGRRAPCDRASARFGGLLAPGLVDVTDDPARARLDRLVGGRR